MKYGKFLVFLILISFLISIGGVSAINDNNTTSIVDDNFDAVLLDNKYANPISESDIDQENISYDSSHEVNNVIDRGNVGQACIQDAIDNASEGDNVNLAFGTYSENIIINKSLVLDFNNSSIIGDGINPTISVIGGANVTLNNVLFDNVVLKLDSASSINFNELNNSSIILQEGDFNFINRNIENVILTIDNALVNINSCNFTNSCVIVKGGKSKIINNIFTSGNAAITQTAGESYINNNIITNNTIGVNVTGGICNLAGNALFLNNLSLFLNTSNVNYDDNWWGKNNPIQVSNNIIDCDICQMGDFESNLNSWIVLDITQSDVLDYDYWIAGITYYNLTVDLNHNNHGKYVTDKFYLNNFHLTSIGDIKERIHHFNGRKLTVEFVYDIVSLNLNLINNSGNFIFTYGYLTSELDQLNFTILGQNYTVPVSKDTISPTISYITPFTIFDDNLTVEIICDDLDAVIFYTLDGTNPAYSTTRLIYNDSLVLNESSTLHYTVIDKWGNFQKYLIDTFTTGANTVSESTDYMGFIKQDVWLELRAYGNYPIYYTFDGSNPAIGYAIAGKGSNLVYTHPFVINEPVEIRFVAQERGYDIVSNAYTTITTYNLDNSVNYLKNNNLTNESPSIWGQYQGDEYNAGVSDYTGPHVNQSFWINDGITSSGSAVVDDKGRIVIGASDGYLYYLNTQGLVIWRFGTTSKIICTPTIGSDGNIYFSNWMDSNMYCVSPNGELLWKYYLGDYNTGTSPVFGWDNQLYVLTGNNNYSTLFVFKNGNLLSKHILPFISGSTPAVGDDGTLYMVSASHELVIVNWDGSLRQSRFIDDGAMHYNLDFGQLMSAVQDTQISVSVGADRTIYILNTPRSATGGDTICFHTIKAFNPDGSLKWSLNRFNEQVSGTPTIYKDVLYITGNNKLIAVNATNGVLLWTRGISGSGNTLSSPLISGDELLYVTSNNMVYAFNLSGELIWKYEMKGKYGNPVSYSSPTLTDKGVLIVTTNQGIYAFRDVAADFTYEHVNNTELTIQFTDLSTKGSNRYYWTFGDGNFSREQNPAHAYASEGRYRVVLLVEHNGNVTLARNTTINVVYHDIVPPSDVKAYINGAITSGGSFANTQHVSLNATDNRGNVIIYYTLDGSSPVNSSTRKIYDGVFDIEIDTVLSMVAVDSSGNIGNVTSIAFIIGDALRINTTLINEIQDLLDNAEPGSKFVFDQDIIGANFTINKPLNLITNNATLTGNGIQPVFTFTESAGGAVLNGFAINNTACGILIDSASDITVRNCYLNITDATGINIVNSDKINVKDTAISNARDGIVVNQSTNTNLNRLNIRDSYNNGVWIIDSDNTVVSNSLLEDNGKDQYKTKANHVLVDNSQTTYIVNNTIERGFFGIHLYHIINNVVIDNNTIREGSGDAILLSNNYSNINITHNLIDGSFNGINFMGYSQNVTIKQNTIENLHDHSDDVYEVFMGSPLFLDMMNYIYEVNVDDEDDYFNHRYNGIQISNPASNFDEGNTVIIDNVVIKLQHRAWEARKYYHYLNAGCEGYGYNMLDGSDSYHGTGGATHYREGKVDMVVDRIGDATFRLRLINRLDGHYLSEIPEFDVTFTAGGFTQTVKFKGSEAVASFDVASVVSDVEVIISTEIRKSAHFNMPITEGYHGSNREFDPGFERGEAYDNPDPVIPKFPEPEDDYPNTSPSNPETPDVPETPEIPETGAGNGTGIGNGTGNGSSFGNGSGTGIGNGTGTGVGEGNGTTFNPNGGNPSDSAKSSSEVSPDGNAGSAGGSSGSDGSKAYEVTKEIDIENTSLWSLVILLLAIFFFIVGWRREGSDDDEL